jgi:hypothetical protein
LPALLNSGSIIGLQHPARRKAAVRQINTWTLNGAEGTAAFVSDSTKKSATGRSRDHASV